MRPRVSLALASLLCVLCPWARASEPTPAAQEPTPTADELSVGSPRLVIRGFTDINFLAHVEGRPTTFALGQFDLFMTSALSDNLSVLSEVVVSRFGASPAAVFPGFVRKAVGVMAGG